ncbi:MAG: protein kinase/lanthionine synthetase C family protein, partial [Chloroflexota bacterium]|nr:protein kinase/lanthionine synthetase C family protein [Chloroflexota bacterium]
SNRGGVYAATDNETGRDVIIKEARPHIEVGRHRLDATTLLAKEWRLLQQLASSGYFAQPVEFFSDGEHAFLAEEFVSGDHLGRYSIRHNPLYHGDINAPALGSYFIKVRHLWLQIAQAIRAAHTLGIVIGDLSFTNIMVTEASRVQIIDLESATEDGMDPPVGLHTPGVTSPHALQSGESDRGNDYYALGAIIFGSIMLANGIVGFYPAAGPRFLEELKRDVGLPDELVGLIQDLMTVPSSPVAEQLIESIEHLPFGSQETPGRFPRLGVPAIERLGRDQRAVLRQDIALTVDLVALYLHNTADAERDDRLFPADLSVFETNPLSVAFGAAGVLYALHRLTGEVPQHLSAWFLRRSITNEQYPPGLYVGQAGIAWVLNEIGYPEVAIQTMRSARQHDLLWHSPNILCGAAGYGMACLKLWTAGLGQEFLDDAVRVGEHLLNTKVRTESGVHWWDEAGPIPLGYAYGGSGVALFLLYLHLATGESALLETGQQSLEFELRQGVWRDGRFTGFPSLAVEESEGSPITPRCYWDAGSAGVATTLVRYLAVAPDLSLDYWVHPLAADVCHKYVVMPQLFHGLAGLGNALLDLWEYGDDERYLADAWQIAEGVLLHRIDCPEGVGFPGEQALRESADFASGAAGIALFLDRLRKAESGIKGNFNFTVDELLPPRPGKNFVTAAKIGR